MAERYLIPEEIRKKVKKYRSEFKRECKGRGIKSFSYEREYIHRRLFSDEKKEDLMKRLCSN